jgi:hypothetical protein
MEMELNSGGIAEVLPEVSSNGQVNNKIRNIFSSFGQSQPKYHNSRNHLDMLKA